MFGDLDWPLNASRGLSVIAEFFVSYNIVVIVEQKKLKEIFLAVVI